MMEVMTKEEEEELISDEVNLLQTCSDEADNDTLSACLFVVAPWFLDEITDVVPDVSCIC